ncbi:unnamed protein product [Oikopleura dioica]|uniref:Uncharacterized protein n=1 Tax=Oikopleura dioica TaxID=34765 RepID=E4XDQ7_OIKDI|nr:unnamed protein product [Oikopleura dioica]
MDLNIRRDFKEAGHERQALEKNFSAELNSVVSKIEQQFSEQHGDPYDPVDTGRYPSERFETNETIGSDCSNRTSSVESWAENAEQLLQDAKAEDEDEDGPPSKKKKRRILFTKGASDSVKIRSWTSKIHQINTAVTYKAETA